MSSNTKRAKRAELTVQTLPMADLRPHPRNPRVHPAPGDPQWAVLKASLAHDYFDPIVWNQRNGMLVSGHLRTKVLRESGFTEADCVVVDYDEATHVARMLAANKLQGQDDMAAIKDLLQDIDTGEFDMALSGYDEKDIENLMTQFHVGGEDDERLSVGEKSTESLVADLREDVRFPGRGKWDLPIIRSDRLIDPEAVPTLWIPGENQNGIVLWNFNSDSTRGLDFARAVVAFYVEDKRFESVWNDTAGHIQPIVNKHTYGMISPNFSCYYDFPAALRMWNVFRSRWIARYAQEAGLRVMPDISGSPEDVEWIFDGIEKGTPVAIQFHREQKEHADKKNTVIEACVKTISPPVIWCYGQEEKSEWYPALKGAECRWIIPRSVVMRRRIGA